jgi:hypothetical protein
MPTIQAVRAVEMKCAFLLGCLGSYEFDLHSISALLGISTLRYGVFLVPPSSFDRDEISCRG